MTIFTIVSDQDAKKLEWIREYELTLNRRVKVETQLWDIYNNLRDLPTREECQEWALLLGTSNDTTSNQTSQQK